MLKTAHKSDTRIKSYEILKNNTFSEKCCRNGVVPTWEPVPGSFKSLVSGFYYGEPGCPYMGTGSQLPRIHISLFLQGGTGSSHMGTGSYVPAQQKSPF